MSEQQFPMTPEEIPSEVAGLRMTKQRREIYSVLLEENDHPTANDIYSRVHEHGISMATVYNVLEALTSHNIVKQVNFDREPSRYCCNRVEHGHFHDLDSGSIHDITFKEGIRPEDFLDLPKGAEVTNLELTLRGHLKNTSKNKKTSK